MEVSSELVETAYGPVRRKIGTGYGLTKSKPEYADLAAAAQTGVVSLRQIKRNIVF